MGVLCAHTYTYKHMYACAWGRMFGGVPGYSSSLRMREYISNIVPIHYMTVSFLFLYFLCHKYSESIVVCYYVLNNRISLLFSVVCSA